MPPVVSLDHAVETIRSLLPAAGNAVVGVTGPVGAGKSTLAARLSSCIISTDHYLPDYDGLPAAERDLPERADLPRLLADLHALRSGAPTRIPQWSFHTHSRCGEREIHPDRVIVVEGLHALHHTHAAAIDVRVYVDAPSTLRLGRWEQLSISGQRGWGLEETREFFHAVAEPTFHVRSHTYRTSAHVVVVNDTSKPELIPR